MKIESSVMARVLYAAGRFDAVLERIGEDDGSELYRDARARQLISQVALESHKLSRGESQIVADYHFRQGEFEEASLQYAEIPDTTRLLECTRKVIRDNRTAARAVVERTVAALIESGEWTNLVSLLTTGKPEPRKKDDSWDSKDRVAAKEILRDSQLEFKTVIPALARSDKLSQADAKSQQRVSEYLADKLIKGSDIVWRDFVPMPVAGAAIERAGKDLDALKFYEQWRDSAASSEERAYAERRWVVCKLRQADREERDGRTRKASGYRRDAETVMNKYGWSEEDVPHAFPDLSAKEPGGETGEGTEAPGGRPNRRPAKTRTDRTPVPRPAGASDHRGRLGILSYRVIAAKGWVNIESDDGLRARARSRTQRHQRRPRSSKMR